MDVCRPSDVCRILAMLDPNTCAHEWVDDGMLEVFPPIQLAHCVKCGLKRRVNTGSGQASFETPSRSTEPNRPTSSQGRDEPDGRR